MTSLEELLQRRSDLEGQIAAIEQTSEGLDNEANAQKAAALRQKQAAMAAEKKALAERLQELESGLAQVNAELTKLAGSGVQRILEAIGKQRWYFFHDNPKILFDKTTALVWANLQYFPYYYDNNGSVADYSCDAGETLIRNHNQQKWGGYDDWKTPLNTELWHLVADKSVPYHEKGNSYWRIKDRDYWAVIYNGKVLGKDLDDAGSTADIAARSVFILPCSHALVPSPDYEEHIKPENGIYSAAEKAHMTLDIFVQHHLEPIFDDPDISALYKQLYIEKPALVQELARVEEKIRQLQEEAVLSPSFDYTVLLAGIDRAKANSSVIPYYQAVMAVADSLIDKVEAYEEQHKDLISQGNAIALQLLAPYRDDAHLDEEENYVLEERQRYLARRLRLGMETVKAQILSVKAQGEDLENRLQDIHDQGCLLDELAAIEGEPRPDIAFVAENLGLIVQEALTGIDFFAKHSHFIGQLVDAWDGWTESYKAFKTKDFEELKGQCEGDGIEGEVYEEWYGDWQRERLHVEKAFLPLVKYALQGHLQQVYDGPVVTGERAWQVLQDYRQGIDDFYLNERKGIYQKFAFQAGGDVQEKFEAESGLFAVAEQFQRQMQELIFSLDDMEDRLFLLKWAMPFMAVHIDELTRYIGEKKLDAISADVLQQFMALRQQNFAAYISDSKAYGEAMEEREKQYNSLIFRMRKDLVQK